MRQQLHRGDDRRISHVEREVTGIKVEVSNLTSGFNSFTAETRSQLSAIFTKLDSKSQTNWGVLLTGAGLALTAILSFSALMLEPVKARVSGNESKLDRFYEARFQDSYERGRLEERVLSQQNQIDELKKRISP